MHDFWEYTSQIRKQNKIDYDMQHTEVKRCAHLAAGLEWSEIQSQDAQLHIWQTKNIPTSNATAFDIINKADNPPPIFTLIDTVEPFLTFWDNQWQFEILFTTFIGLGIPAILVICGHFSAGCFILDFIYNYVFVETGCSAFQWTWLEEAPS